ncbi:unnamed protein product [Linum trigynum]|uniref:Uncharacterized protein n=1 Tax=Linum trigynum TaxID=586398 RepID=A0AAV2CVQ0_9ROSI
MTCADIREDSETKILRFLSGLSKEIQYELKLRHFVDLEEAIHFAVKIEKHLKQETSRDLLLHDRALLKNMLRPPPQPQFVL